MSKPNVASQKFHAILPLLLAHALLAAPAAPKPAPKLARAVIIHRDTYGVPHIYGKTDAAVVFGMMYAQAEDNFWQLEDDYVRILGRAAELYGQKSLPGDIVVHAYQAVDHARQHYQSADPQLRALCDAFADGINYYLATHPATKPRLLAHFEPWFLLAVEHRGPVGRGIQRSERDLAFPALAGTPLEAALRLPGDLPANPETTDEGSNMWAVSAKRSASGNPLLLINPHIGFFGSGQRYEAHLHSDEGGSKVGLDASGFAILGTPYIRSGHNPDIAWSHTNNYANTSDVYLETFDDPSNPLAYRYGTGHRIAVEWTEELKIRSDAGLKSVSVTFRRTHHGPVLGMRKSTDGRTIALTVRAAEAAGGAMAQRWAMAKCRNLTQFQSALSTLALTGSNTIYADRAGNIFYLHGNAIPKRSTKFDWSRPVDGADPETEWSGLHPLKDLPQVLNPKSGYLQNCNSTPFLTSDGPDNPKRSDYPAYMVPELDTARAKRSREILSGTRKFTFDEWARAAMDTTFGLAADRLPELDRAYSALRSSDPARAQRISEPVAELLNWDHVGRVDSVPATLFIAMEQHAITLRRANPSDPYTLIAALEESQAELQRTFGTWRVPWGDINRMQRVHTSGIDELFSDDRPSFPVPGAPSFAGAVFTFGSDPVPGQKRWYGTKGDTYVAVVELAKRPRTMSLLVFGQSADPKSPHHTDQADLYATQRFKPAWFALAEIRKHAEVSYHPGGRH